MSTQWDQFTDLMAVAGDGEGPSTLDRVHDLFRPVAEIPLRDLGLRRLVRGRAGGGETMYIGRVSELGNGWLFQQLSAGKRTRNVAPSPSAVRSSIWPPCATTMDQAIDRPSPAPP